MLRERQMAERALAERADAGRPLQFWWRDDDAVTPSPDLDRLLVLANSLAAPLTLAVIPAPWNAPPTGTELAHRLSDEPMAHVAVHGWSHRNHAPAGHKKQELHPDRPIAQMRDELRQGLAILGDLHGSRALPLLVPPWNRIAPDLLPFLRQDGFRAISTFGPEASVPGLQVVNTHLDVIDWRRGGNPRDPAEMWRELRSHAESGRDFLGLLTHHLVHCEENWSFIAQLIEVTKGNGGIWKDVTAIGDA